MGNTLAGAALLACIAGAITGVFFMKHHKPYGAPVSLTQGLGEVFVAKLDQGKEATDTISINAAGQTLVTANTAAEDVHLMEASLHHD